MIIGIVWRIVKRCYFSSSWLRLSHVGVEWRIWLNLRPLQPPDWSSWPPCCCELDLHCIDFAHNDEAGMLAQKVPKSDQVLVLYHLQQWSKQSRYPCVKLSLMWCPSSTWMAWVDSRSLGYIFGQLGKVIITLVARLWEISSWHHSRRQPEYSPLLHSNFS